MMDIMPAVRRHVHACPYRRPLPIVESYIWRGPDRMMASVMRCKCGWFLWVAA